MLRTHTHTHTQGSRERPASSSHKSKQERDACLLAAATTSLSFSAVLYLARLSSPFSGLSESGPTERERERESVRLSRRGEWRRGIGSQKKWRVFRHFLQLKVDGTGVKGGAKENRGFKHTLFFHSLKSLSRNRLVGKKLKGA